MCLCERPFSLGIQHEGCFCFTTEYPDWVVSVLYVVFVFIWSMCVIPYINVNIPKGEGFFSSINHARAGKNVGYISSLSGVSAW